MMDEPTASLETWGIVSWLWTRSGRWPRDGLAVLLSTHEPEQAFAAR